MNNKETKRNKTFDLLNKDKRFCKGCETTFMLSRAHIISRTQRPDLKYDITNMAYLCMSNPDKKGCHNIWDGTDKEEKKKLKCYNEFMDYIKENDINLYNRLNHE